MLMNGSSWGVPRIQFRINKWLWINIWSGQHFLLNALLDLAVNLVVMGDWVVWRDRSYCINVEHRWTPSVVFGCESIDRYIHFDSCGKMVCDVCVLNNSWPKFLEVTGNIQRSWLWDGLYQNVCSSFLKMAVYLYFQSWEFLLPKSSYLNKLSSI